MCNLSRTDVTFGNCRGEGWRKGFLFRLFCKLKPREVMGVNGVTPAEPLAFSFSAKWKEESGAVRGGIFVCFFFGVFFFTAFPFSSEAHPENRPWCLLTHTVMPQPPALLFLRLCKWSYGERLHNWEPGSRQPVTNAALPSTRCRVCFQHQASKSPFCVPVPGTPVTSHCPWLSCF